VAAIVWADLQAYVASLASISGSDPRVVDLLADVNTALDVRLFEHGESDPKLRRARIYRALHDVVTDVDNFPGIMNAAGPVTQESDGGLLRQYAAFSDPDGSRFSETYWGRKYLQIVRGKRAGGAAL
jgi:hypothetical protein